MTQSDFILADDTFPNYHADLNLMVKALASLSEGATEPATKYASQPWADTSVDTFKIRNKANTAWIEVFDFDYSNDRVEFIANIFHAASTAGYTFKSSTGTTLLTVSNTGLLTTGTGGLALGGPLNANSFPFDMSQGADVATASDALVLRDGNVFEFTGTTQVDTIEFTADDWPVGSVIFVKAIGVFIWQHSTFIECIGSDDIPTQAGDWVALQKYITGKWRMIFYQRADGSSVVGNVTLKAILRDEKTSGTNGQAPTANTWTKHNLQTEEYDPDGLTSIASDEFTVTKAGYVKANFVGRDVFTGRLYNISDSIAVSQGNTGRSAGGEVQNCLIVGPVIAGKTYRIDMMQSTGNVSLANGFAGVVENYLTVEYYAS